VPVPYGKTEWFVAVHGSRVRVISIFTVVHTGSLPQKELHQFSVSVAKYHKLLKCRRGDEQLARDLITFY